MAIFSSRKYTEPSHNLTPHVDSWFGAAKDMHVSSFTRARELRGFLLAQAVARTRRETEDEKGARPGEGGGGGGGRVGQGDVSTHGGAW